MDKRVLKMAGMLEGWRGVAGIVLGTVFGSWAASSVSVQASYTDATPGWGTTAFATLQSAVDAVEAGGTVYVFAGTYTAPVTLSKPVVLQGEGRGKSILEFSVSQGAQPVKLSAAGCVLTGFEIVKTDKLGPQNLIYVAADDVVVSNCFIRGQYVLGDGDVSRAFEVAHGCSRLLIDANEICALRQPGYLNGSTAAPTTGTVSNNRVSATRGWVIAGANVCFTGNTWGCGAQANYLDIAILSGTAAECYTNIPALCADNGGAVVQDQRVSGANLSVAFVDAAAAAGGDGTPTSPVQTLPEGLGKVLAGGVVRLAPGTYSSGALTVAKAVSILGANAGKAGADLARVAETRIRNSKLTLAAAATVDGVEIYQTDDTPDAVLVQAGACLRNSVIRREGVNTGKIVRGVVTAVGTSGFAVERNLFTGDSSGGLFGGHKTWNTGFWLNGGAGRVSDNVFAVCRTAVNLDDFNDHVILADNVFRTCGSYVSIGGTTPVDGSLTIAGNAFSFDYAGAANPTLFNNSNVASTFKLNAVDNTFGGLATENLSDAQKVMIEACIYHRGRNGTKRGVVRFVAGEQVVVATNTTVQSAVDAAMAGDRVLLSTGAHVGEVQISKALRLNGLSGAVIEGQVTLDAENIEVAGVTLATDRQWKVTTRASIQSGIDAAAAGERVAIQSGPYSGHIDASEKSVALAVGASPGQAVITGNLTLTADDQLEMELNGTEPGSAAGFDQWVVNGTVALNGAKLAASLGFTPAAGRAFAILVNDGTDAVVGTFAGLAEGSAFDLGGVTFSITYAGGDGNDVVLTVLAPAEVFVDDDYSAEVYDQGVWGYSAFAKIQEAVDAAMDYGWVYVSEGTYTETLTVAKNLSIVGAGARSTIIDAAGAGRVLEISGFDAANHIETVVSGLTLAHGQAEDYGAGVFLSFANVAIHDSVIRNCNAALGGAIANFHEADRVILDGSTLHGNTAGTSAQGGAINMFGGLLALTNCTVSGNSANQGGGLYLEGTEFAFEHITVTTNTVSGRGALAGGIRFSGTGSMSHSIVAGNVGGADCYGAFGGEFNLTSGAPKLAALGDFGGPTPTHALLTNSPALNGGSPTAVAADQRGVPRSQGSAPDIGAFETVYNAYVDCAYTAESCDGHVWGQDAFASIQAAINAVAVGGTVNVAAGTFTEVITVNKRVSLVGAGSGADGTILSAPAAASTHLGVVNLTASGLSQESPILIENVRVSATACAGLSVGLFTEATGTSVEYVKLDNVKVYGTNTSPSTEQERGLYVDLTSTLKHLAVTDCAFDNLTYGWYFAKQVSVDASTVQYVTVTGTSYSHNNHKGVYAEKLSDATFTGCTVAGNGFDGSVLPSYFVPWMCGIDLNLKAGNYANLTFDSCAITDNALGGALHGVGIAVKARDDGSTYGPFPASCAGVSITGCTITGNERGVRIGEPGKNNAGPTEVEIENCVIAGNDKRYAGTDGSAYGGLINMSQAAVDADNNYWGDASGPAGAGDDVIAVGTGPVTPNPYFTEAALQNHAPYDMALSEAAVSENGAVGAVVGTLSTTDVDAGNTFTYALVEGAGADDNGAFAIDGEVLKTVTGFNFETKDSYSIRVRTTDSHVNNAGVYEAVFTITVTDVEETPVLGSVGNQSTAEDTLLAFAATATDSDGDPLTFAWTGVPAGATATDAGAFSWTPTQAQIGIYTLTVTVSDGTGRSDSEEFTITVTAVNDNPTVANALGDLNKQQDFGTTNIALASVFADAENDALAYTVAVTGDPVLSAAINGTTLTLTSAALARGTATVTVTATESGTPEHLFVSNVFTVTVKPVWNTTKNTFFDTIQAAIDAVATVANDVITVAAGTYSGNLTISKGIALRSVAGPATTILIGTGGAAVKAESNGVEITGFTIRNPSGTQGFYAKNRSQLLVSGNVFETIGTAQAAPSDAVCGVMVWCTSTAVDTVVIRDNVMRLIESKATTKSAHGVWIGDSTGSADLTGLLIQSNAISQVTSARGAYGIVIGHARPPANTGRTIGARILDNTFSDISGSWAHAIGLEGNTPNAVVSGNSIARLADLDSPAKPDAVGVMVETNPDAQTLTIASNSFTNMAYGVVNKMANPVTANGNYWGSATPDIDALVIGDVVTDSFYADAALADLRFYAVYVDDSFATESGNQFKTIQGGVDAVSPYGTVHVAAGAYAGVTLVKSVKLLGANAGVAGYGTRADESVVSSVVNMTGADTSVMIDGFKFAVTPHLMFGANLAESKQTADWTFQNNLVEASGAIYSEVGNVNLNWRDVVVTRNRFANMTSNAVITHNVRSLTATDNQFDTLGAGGNALVCQNITSLEVAGNSFSNIGWNAVQLVGAESVTITNNVCSNLGAEAFKLGGPIVSGVCSYNTIVGANTSKEIDVGGIRIRVAAGQPYNVAIIGNYIENSFNGLAVRNNDVLAGTAITVAQNTFVGNSNAGLYNGGTGTLAASSNFWGTAFGPSGTGFFGTGDAIVGPVAIASYYIAAPLTTLHYYDLYVDVNGIEDVNHFKTIQAAYAAANPGDTIHVADGGYTLGSTFTVAKQGLTITGTSSAAVSIDASARTGTAYGIHVAASDVTLEHFTLIPASYAGAGFPIHVSGTPGILSNITLRDIVIANSYRTPFDFNGVDNLTLEGLVASGADYGSGIGLSGCAGVTIAGCTTSGNAWGGVRVSGSTDVEPDRVSSDVAVNFANNAFGEPNALYVEGTASTVLATGYSYRIETPAGASYLEEGVTEAQAIALTLQGELLTGVNVTGLYSNAAGTYVPFDADLSTAVVYVDDSWAGTPNGTGIPKPGSAGAYLLFGRNAFATVPAGVAGVDAGGTVNVLAGTYSGAFTVAQPVTVLGPNDNISPNTGVRAPEALLQGTTTSGLSASVAIDATNVVLRGLTFNNLRIDNYNGNAHEPITGDVVAFNRFINVVGTPIYLRDGRDANGLYGAGVAVVDNEILTPIAADGSDFGAGSGIVLKGAEASEVSRNVISSAAYNGIQLGRCNGMSLVGNIATNVAQPALQIAEWNDGTFTLSGNTFSTLSTAKAAVRLYGFTNNYFPQFTFAGNTIKDSKYGIQIGREDTGLNDIVNADYSFSGNTFSNIGTYRLVVYLGAAASAGELTEMDALFAQVYATGSTAKATTSAVPFTYIAVPNAVWVDDSYTAETCGEHIWGYDAFTSIQSGINAVKESGTVHTEAGSYTELVSIAKALTLVNEPARSATVTAPASADKAALVTVDASNVTIDGLVFAVNQPDATAGVFMDASTADPDTNLTVQNCRFTISGTINTSGADAYIGFGTYSTAIAVKGSGNAFPAVTITGNEILPDSLTAPTAMFDRAIYTGQANGTIENNTVYGDAHDLCTQFVSGGTLAVLNNRFLGKGGRDVKGAQIDFTEPNASGIIVFQGNTINPFGPATPSGSAHVRSLMVKNNASGAAISILSNLFTNVQEVAVLAGNSKNTTVSGNEFKAADGDSDFTYVQIGNKVMTGGTGYAPVQMNAVVQGNLFRASTVPGGRAIEFLNHNATGATFGSITVGGPEALANRFAAGLDRFISLDDEVQSDSRLSARPSYAACAQTVMAPFPASINATQNLFDVGAGAQSPEAMSLADLYALENKIHHSTDVPALGLVRARAGNVYVTQASGSIQRGVTAATAGDTVNVAAGSFLENVTITKALTLLGANANKTWAERNGAAETLVYATNAVAVLTVASSHVGINGFELTSPIANNLITHSVGTLAAPTEPSHLKYSFNYIHDVGTTERSGNVYGIQYLVRSGSPSDIEISDNQFENIGSTNKLEKSSGAIYFGDSAATGVLSDLRIERNHIRHVFVTAAIREARGIAINTGANAGGSITGLIVAGNDIADIYGGSASGINVAGNTPGAVISHNVVNAVTSTAEPLQGAAILVETNTGAGSMSISGNSLTGAQYGILNKTASTVNAEHNWFGSATGPACAENAGGSGAAVAGLVDFSPWLGDGSDAQVSIGFQPHASPVYYLPVSLMFSQQPGSAALGAALNPPPVVTVLDEIGQVATQFVGAVSLTLETRPGSGQLSGMVSVTATAGVATFTDVAVVQDGGEGFTLRASASPLAAVSDTFTIGNPPPGLTGMDPIFKAKGSAGFVLTVTGSDFVPSTKVLWNGSERQTVFVSGTQLTAEILASDLATSGSATVTVHSPTSAASGALTFTIPETALAAAVFVDDDWTCYGNCGGHLWGYDAFKTIQGGVNAASENGTVHVAAGTYNEDVLVNKTVLVLGTAGAAATTVSGQIGGDGATIRISAIGVVIDGFTITRIGNNAADWNNPSLNSAGIAIQGQTVRGTVRNCVITGNRTGVDINNSNGNVLMNNAITFNRTGLIMRNQTDNLTIVENEISDNWTVGVLFLDASGGSNSPAQTAANCAFYNNTISGNWYGDICDRQTGGSLPAPGSNLKNFSGNWFGTAAPVVSTDNSTEPGYSVQIPVAFGGSAVNPGGAPNILGAASANIDYTPWLAVGADTDNGAVGFKGDFSSLWVDDDSMQAGPVTRIQEGVDMVATNGTLNVSAGTYVENVTVGKCVSVIGAGSGLDGTVLAAAAGDSKIGVINLTGSGASDATPMLFKDLLVSAVGRSGFSVGRFTLSTGVSVDYVKLENVRVIGSGATPCTEQERGLYVDLTSSLQHLVVSGCAFDNLHYGWYIQKAVSADASTVRYVTVSDTTFNDNATKGIYAEKLADATFTGCEVARNGSDATLLAACNYFAPWMSGVDINLKAGAYANLSFMDCAITDNALGGAKEGVGITIKARDDGATYGANPAACTGVLISGCTITGNERGVRIGEPGKNNATPANVTIENCMIAGNVQQYNGADGSAYGGLINMTSALVPIHAESNWWGDMAGPSVSANAGGVGDSVTVNVDFSPWYGEDMATQYYTPKYLVFSAEPLGTTLSTQLAPQPVVTVMGENELPATQFSGVVTLALGSNPGLGTLSGTTQAGCQSGVATFSGLAVTVGGGASLTLVASAANPISGATSAAFDVANPAPTAASLSPYWTHAGSGDVAVTVTGAGFVPTSVAQWNRAGSVTALQTAFVSETQLTVVVPATLVEQAGTANIFVATPASGGGMSGSLQFRIEAVQPSVVYVDDDYAAFENDTLVAHDRLPEWLAIKGYDAFSTIQEALDAVAADGTVHVAAGDYVEDLVSDKPVRLLGPNAAISPNGGDREDEAIIYPATSAPDPFTTGQQMLYVAASGVVVKGFMFNGNNPNLDSGVLVKGVDVDACEAIASYEGVGGVVIENNVIRNISYAAIDLYNWVKQDATSGNVIRNNRIENVGHIPYGFGIGVLLYNNCYAVVENNVMTAVRVGVQTGNFSQSDPGDAHAIRNNMIAASRRGVFHNLHYSAATDFVISGNAFTAVEEPGVSRWDGVLLASLQGSVGALVEDNTVSVAGAISHPTVGYHTWNTPTTGSVLLRGGSVSGAQVGVWANNFDGYNLDGGATHLTVEDVAISGATRAGVYVKDNTNSTRAAVQILLTGATRISGCTDGVLIEGEKASVSLAGAAISTAIRYVALAGDATNDVDATAVVFDGQTGSEMTLSDLLAAEDKITHQLDDPRLGFVRVKAGEAFVTQTSGSIQRGIDAAMSGDTVHVGAGTYKEQVTVAKGMTVLGDEDNPETVIIDGENMTTLPAPGQVRIYNPTGPVVFAGFTLTNVACKAASDYFGILTKGSQEITIQSCRVFGHRNSVDIGSDYGMWAAGGAGALTVKGCYFRDMYHAILLECQLGATTIDDNIFDALYTGAYSGAQYGGRAIEAIVYGSADVTALQTVRGNKFVNFKSTGVLFSGGFSGQTPRQFTNVLIEENDFSFDATDITNLLGAVCLKNVSGTLNDSPAGGVTAVVRNNTITVPSGNGITVSGLNGAISVVENYLAGNGASAVNASLSLGSPISAEDNWWDDSTGPANAKNPGGSGNAVMGNVDFSPWLAYGTDMDPVATGFQPDLSSVLYLPVSLAFTVQPVGTGLGEWFAVQPQVMVENEVGGVATQFNGTVSVALANNPGSGTLNGTLAVPVVGGVATFTDLSITIGGGSDFTLVAASASPIADAISEPFAMANPPPTLSSMSPIFIAQGSETFTLTVDGSSFVPTSKVMWNGAERTTTFVSSSRLAASIPASDVAASGSALVSVFTPAAGGGTSGAALTFSITASAQAPVVYVDDEWTGYGDCGGHVWGYDAFATIQGGLNGVGTDGTVNVRQGTYSEDVSTAKRVKIVGSSDGEIQQFPTVIGSIRIDNNGGMNDNLLIQNLNFVVSTKNALSLYGVNGAIVRNCTFDGTGKYSADPKLGVEFERGASNGNSDILVENCVFSNGLYVAVGGYCLRATIKGCTLADFYEGGINLQGGGGGLVVQDCEILVKARSASAHAYGVRYPSSAVDDITIAGCDISVDKNGLQPNVGVYHAAVIIRAGAGGALKVNNCSLNGPVINLADTPLDASGNWWGGNAPAVVQAAANGGTLVDYTPWLAVSTDTDEGAVGFKGDFSSLWVDDNSAQAGTTNRIQEGVNLVSSSGTVNVLAGTYRENVVLNKPVTVRGDPGDLTAGPGVNAPILDGDLDNNGTPDKGDGFTIPRNSNLSGITVEGFIIQNFSNGIPSGGNGVGVGVISWENTSSHVTIQDNEFRNLGYNGVYVGTDSDDMQSDWLVQRNVVTGAPYAGIELTDVRDSQVLNNVITAPTTLFPDAGDAGVGIEIAARSRVGLVAVTNILVQGNTISGLFASGSRAGINLLARAYNSGSADALLSGITVLANVVTGSGTRGIDVVAESRNGKPSRIENLSITQNDLSGNATGIMIGEAFTAPKANGTYDAGIITIQNNNLESNTAAGVSNLSGATVIAERNWFGGLLTGPLNVTNPGGTGAAVVGPVDFSPWLGDGSDTLADFGFQPNTAPVYYLPVSLHFSTQPGGALLGAPLAPQPIVVVSNEVGGVAEQFNGAIALAIGINHGTPGVGVLTGAATLAVTNGFAAFSDLAITLGTGNGYTLVASTTGLDPVSSATFDILNSAPVLGAIGNKNVNEQQLLSFQATATHRAADEEGQAMTFCLLCDSEQTMPEGITFDPQSGVFAWQTTEAQGGKDYTFTVTVSDNGTDNLCTRETITVAVAEVNVAPVLPEIADRTVDEQTTLSFTVPQASDQDIPPQTLTYTLDDASVAAGMAIDGSTGAFSWTPTELQGGTDYDVTVTVTDNGLNAANLAAVRTFKIRVTEINVAPVLAPIPPQSVNFGQTLTFMASATEQDRVPTQTLTFSLAAIEGQNFPAGASIETDDAGDGTATGTFVWTPSAEQAQSNYTFTVTVTDNGSPVASASQTVTIGAVSASQSCAGYWSPSTNMVVSNSFAFAGMPTGLTWTPIFPNANWVITAVDAGGNGVAIVSNGMAVVFTTLPATSPAVFRYTVRVPGDQAVSNSLGAVVSFSGLTADVAPMAIFRYHSADYRRDVSGTTAGQFRKIDSTEVNRVLAYWRYGYKPDASGYDGYMAVSGYAGLEANHHSADINKDWRINTPELMKVQGYWRGNGYHVDLTSADGYANDRAGVGPSLFAMRIGFPSATQKAPAAYNPGECVQVDYTFDSAGAELLALGWKPNLPEGWVIESVSGDGSPELANGEIVCSAAVLPNPTCRLVLAVRVPLAETRTVVLSGEAQAITAGKSEVVSFNMKVAVLAPADSDGNGMADAWEKAYVGSAGSLDPQADLDGDRLSNYEEYLCGTVPTDAQSVLKMVSIRALPGGLTEISWASVAGRVYILQRADGSPAPANFESIKADIAADPSGRNVCVDDGDTTRARFYRVLLQD